MIEVARSDENKTNVELEVISEILVSKLGGPYRGQLIIDAAQERSEEAHDLFHSLDS